MGNGIWVLAEAKGEQVARVSLELLGRATELSSGVGGPVACLLIGYQVDSLVPELARQGAQTVYLAGHPRLAYYQSEAYASIVAGLVRQHMPEVLLFGSTDTGMDLAPRVAAKLGTGLTAHCVDLTVEKRQGVPLVCQIVPGWGDNMLGILCPQKRPQMATVRPGVFRLPRGGQDREAVVVRVPVRLDERLFRAETIEVKDDRSVSQPLEGAETVIAVGWGVYSLGSLSLVEELAQVTGGVIGGTRPMVDRGWVSADRMIGQSGKTVGPQLFISLGASGAMHFTTGFERAGFVLAVDQNPEAPIFKVADAGIVGDLREVLPCLIDEFRKLKGFPQAA